MNLSIIRANVHERRDLFVTEDGHTAYMAFEYIKYIIFTALFFNLFTVCGRKSE